MCTFTPRNNLLTCLPEAVLPMFQNRDVDSLSSVFHASDSLVIFVGEGGLRSSDRSSSCSLEPCFNVYAPKDNLSYLKRTRTLSLSLVLLLNVFPLHTLVFSTLLTTSIFANVHVGTLNLKFGTWIKVTQFHLVRQCHVELETCMSKRLPR